MFPVVVPTTVESASANDENGGKSNVRDVNGSGGRIDACVVVVIVVVIIVAIGGGVELIGDLWGFRGPTSTSSLLISS